MENLDFILNADATNVISRDCTVVFKQNINLAIGRNFETEKDSTEDCLLTQLHENKTIENLIHHSKTIYELEKCEIDRRSIKKRESELQFAYCDLSMRILLLRDSHTSPRIPQTNYIIRHESNH